MIALDIKKTRLVIFFVAAAVWISLSPRECLADEIQDRNLFFQKIADTRESKPSDLETVMAEALTSGKASSKELKYLYQCSQVFDDNVFLQRRKRKSDWITTATPQLKGILQDREKILSLSVAPDIAYYAQNGHMTRWQDFKTNAETLFFRNSKLQLKLRDSLQRATTVSSGSDIKPTRTLTNKLNAGLQYDISPKSSLLLDATQEIIKYLGNTNKPNSYMRHIVTPSFLWRLSKKTALRSSYNFGLVHHPKLHAINSSFHKMTVGITGAVTPKSNVDLELGYMYKRYHDPLQKNVGTFVGLGGYNYLWTEKTTMRIFGGRSVEETTASSQRYVLQTFGGIGIGHLLTPKLSTGISATFGYSDYPSSAIDPVDGDVRYPNTSLLGMKALLGYSLNKLFYISLTYDYLKGFARLKDSRYWDNKVSIALNGMF